MICCWCGRGIASQEDTILGFRPGQFVHVRCFFDYVDDAQVDRQEVLEQLELGGEA